MRICENCGGDIPESKRAGARYCNNQCQINAKQQRRATKVLSGLDEDENYYKQTLQPQSMNPIEQLRQQDKEHNNEITRLREDYTEKLRRLENEDMKNGFKIENFEREIRDLKEKYEKELKDAQASGTKDLVNSVTRMPSVQGFLGTLANTLIKPKKDALGAIVEEEYGEAEKQIINGIRAMQPDVQGHMVNTLYQVFAMTHAEQQAAFENLLQFFGGDQDLEEDELP